MKTLITLFLLIASPLLASTNYIAIIYSESLKDPDKTIAKVDGKSLFTDATEVQWENMSKYCLVADTNVLFRIVVYPVDMGTVKKKVTKASAEANIKDKVSESSKVTVLACGKDPTTDLKKAGYIHRDGGMKPK